MATESVRERIGANSFKNKVSSYLINFSRFLNIKEVDVEHQNRVVRIIDRNNQIADLLESGGSDGYKAIVEQEIALRGEAKLGYVYCIDGRIPTIFLAGRFANAWEEPAGLIGTINTDDGNKIPKSTILDQALEETVREDRDVLEIFFAHTSSIEGPNTCGYMNALHQDGLLPENITDLTLENLRQFEEIHIPAVTEYYNRINLQKGRDPLARVGVGAVYETDKMGIVLNYGQKDKQFSTSEYINEYRYEIESIVGEHLGEFGNMRSNFTDPENFIKLSKKTLELTKFLLGYDSFTTKIDGYLTSNYGNLTEKQSQALRFVLVRTMALQYITGLSDTSKNEEHPFTNHQEDYLSVSLAGKPVGRFDPKEQVFASTPSDTLTAVKDIRLKLTLMDRHHANKPYLLFVSNPVKKADWDKYKGSESEAINRNIALNASLFRTIVADEILKGRIKDGSLLVVPVLVDQNTGEILDVVDHSALI